MNKQDVMMASAGLSILGAIFCGMAYDGGHIGVSTALGIISGGGLGALLLTYLNH